MHLFGKDHNQRFTLEVNSKLLSDLEGKPVGIHSISRDISERKEAEARQLVCSHPVTTLGGLGRGQAA